MSVVIERSRTIKAAPAAVWAVLADFPAIATWAANVQHSSPATEATSGVGATRRVQVGRIAVLEQIVEWEPEHGLGYTISGLPPAAGRVSNTWQLDAEGDDTAVTLTTRIDPLPGPPGRIVARVLSRTLGKASDTMLQGLASRLSKQEKS